MTDENDDVLGPIDFIIIEFSGGLLAGQTAAELVALVDNGTIRLYDLIVVRKDADGTVSGVDLSDVADGSLGGFGTLGGARSGLISDEDVKLAADAIAPDTVAALILYENRWAEPFVDAARREGGQMIVSSRVPAQDLLDVLDELDPS